MSNLKISDLSLDNVKIVIFDKDGTLIDIHHYWCSMIKFRADFFIQELTLSSEKKERLYVELVENMGINLATNKMKPEGPVGIKPRNFIIDVAHSTVKKYDEHFTREMVSSLFDRVDEYSKTKLGEIVELLDGAVELLASLKKADVLIAIATTDLSTRAALAMQSLGIDTYFDTIAGADLVPNAKPNADLVNYILEKHHLDSKASVVIGDAMADLSMAKNANSRFIGVKTGLYTDEFVKNSEVLIESLHEIRVEKC